MNGEKSVFEVEIDPRAKEVLAKAIREQSFLSVIEGPVRGSAFHDATHIHRRHIETLLREVDIHQEALSVPLRISISIGEQQAA